MERTELTARVTELHQKYGGLVERRCRTMLGDREAAADAAQEVFLRLLRSWEQFRAEASPVTWLYQVTTNICIDELRRRARRATAELTPAMEQVLAHGAPSTEAVVGGRQELRGLLERLDPEVLQVLVHLHLDGMTQEEIAATLGVTRKTVWARLNRVRQLEPRCA